MCKAPKAPKVSVEKPEFMTNPFLDNGGADGGSIAALRSGTSALRIPLNTGLGIGFAPGTGSSGQSASAGAQGNARGRSGLSAGGGGITPLGSPVALNKKQRKAMKAQGSNQMDSLKTAARALAI